MQIEYTKIVQSGDLLEIYDYEKAPSNKRFVGSRHTYKQGVCVACGKVRPQRYRLKRSKRHIQRAKDNFRRLVRASLSLGNPYFVTLTMVSIVDIKEGYRHFTKFTNNLRKLYGKNIAWVAVPEFQRRGAVHFHALIWGIPYENYLRERDTRDLQTCWMRGWCDILASDGSPKIASYMAKYMSKTMSDDRLKGQKSYTASRNTVRSVLYNSRAQLAWIKEEHREIDAGDKLSRQPDFERVYKTEWLGRCHYRVYEKTITK